VIDWYEENGYGPIDSYFFCVADSYETNSVKEYGKRHAQLSMSESRISPMTAVESCPCNSVNGSAKNMTQCAQAERTECSFDDTNFCRGGLETSECTPIVYD
jgi:hypothetical protein